MIGRRVGTFDEVQRAGDYYGPVDEVDQSGSVVGRGVWFRECPDGSLEIRESIACGRHDPEGEYFHGYLDEGHVWRTL